MELQEKVRRVQEFRLMDDVFFEVFAKDIPACQEILRTILEDDRLIVEEVIVQSSERNLSGWMRFAHWEMAASAILKCRDLIVTTT